jgi:hypothetical protein
LELGIAYIKGNGVHAKGESEVGREKEIVGCLLAFGI